jgi:hypothetical protein
MEISTKLYVAGYKNVKAKSFDDSPYAPRGFVILSAAKDLVPTYGQSPYAHRGFVILSAAKDLVQTYGESPGEASHIPMIVRM